MDEINWNHRGEVVATFVQCCYGVDGDEPGDNWVMLQRGVREDDDDGVAVWRWISGDDSGIYEESRAFATRAEAETDGMDYAVRMDEGDGVDADALREARLRSEAGRPVADGSYSVCFVSAGDETTVVDRYATYDAAKAAMRLAQNDLVRSHRGGALLCGYEVRVLQRGRWVWTESECA